ncbi:MAG: dCTP deaminase [Thaumarchaeota archaeon]|nr:dCTP deaminase [Candidatus Calditenuaceae archaeon]MDW8187127.1 dCTP deaminase [Nitrososphaerota archaeon]
MILSDFDLWNYIKSGRMVIDPIHGDTVRENGLDLRIGDEMARLKSTGEVLDTYDGDVSRFYELERGASFVIRPREHVLMHTVEYISMPRDLMGFVNLRSTFARLGLSIPPTIIDANFEGQLTIEMVGGEFPVRLHAGQRFLHVVFAKLTSEVSSPYRGKYQGQRGVRLPELREKSKV